VSTTPAKTRANIDRFAAALSPAAIGALAEIDEGDPGNEHRMVRLAFGRGPDDADTDVRNMPTREPIFAGSDWHMGEVATLVGMRGIVHASPTRLVSGCQITHAATGYVVPVITWHGPTHAYNGPHDAPHRAELIDGWGHCFDVGRRAIAAQVDQGRPVIFVGDMNRHDMPLVHPRERRLGDYGPDHLGVVLPDGWAVGNLRTRTVPLTIDTHDGHLITVTLTSPHGVKLDAQVGFANFGR